MDIEVFEDGLTKEDCIGLPHRTACRGIVKRGDEYLMVRLTKHDITTFPGGGMEPGETEEECVVREVLEETGIICKVVKRNVSVTEYFVDSVWTNVYFTCEYVEDTKEVKFTQEEVDLGLVTEWRTLDYILHNFENNMTLHEHGPAIHNREFLGLIHSM